MNEGPIKVEVFAILCSKCKLMESVVHAAVAELPEIECDIIKSQDLISLRERGVMANPALIIDDKIVAMGNVPTIEQTKDFIREAFAVRSGIKASL
jgi:predicted DsbA family dithiol-disulfide isomerase